VVSRAGCRGSAAGLTWLAVDPSVWLDQRSWLSVYH
jgi:hypothetical protein